MEREDVASMFASELAFEKNGESDLLWWLNNHKENKYKRKGPDEHQGDDCPECRRLEGQLAKVRQRIAELEAAPPTPEQTLEWFKAKEEEFIDRRNKFNANPQKYKDSELGDGLTSYIAEVRKQISKLEPAQPKSEKFPLERMRCYAGGEGEVESSLRTVWTVENNRVRYVEFEMATGESTGAGECSVKEFLAWVVRPATQKETTSFHRRPKTPAEQRKARKDLLQRWFTNDKFLKRLSKTMVRNCFRNSPLEDIHAGDGPDTYDQYRDTKVVWPGGECSWDKASRITQDEMKELMIYAVNHVYTVLHELVNGPNFENIYGVVQMFEAIPDWNEPELDASFSSFLRDQIGKDFFGAAFFMAGPEALID
jgi:hypothetical protein